MDNRSYVYLHKLYGDVVYVGIGTGDRIKSTIKRQKEHLVVWDLLEKVKVAEHLSKDDAHKLEQELLDRYFDSGRLFNKRRNSDKVKTISYSDVSSNFYYDEQSPSKLMHLVDKFCGEFKSVKSASANSPAGTLNTVGYYAVSMYNQSFLAHRLVYCLISKTDIPSDKVVDHIDGNRSNNLISNLRLLSRSDNSRNKKHKTTNTGYQSITDVVKKQYFSVGYRLDFKTYRICFSYNPNPSKTSRNHYPSRDAAFEAAIEYRNTLIAQGVITLTGK